MECQKTPDYRSYDILTPVQIFGCMLQRVLTAYFDSEKNTWSLLVPLQG